MRTIHLPFTPWSKRAPARRSRTDFTARPSLEELEVRLALSLPYPDHVVIAIEENHGYTQIIGSSNAPYINSLAQQGALFTQSYAIEHPSEPNYLDLFSGSNQGVHDDSCPHTFSTPNLGGELEATGYSFGAYSEDLPGPGSTACTAQNYARKHAPWVNFTDINPTDHVPFAGYFPDDFTTLPTVAFVIPNQNNDMHNGSGATPIQRGDAWLQTNLDAYAQWTYANNSLFILTFDEDNGAQGNRIATLFIGPMVVPGQYSETIDHYTVLRTLEDIYGLDYAGASANEDPIQDVWTDGGGAPGTHGHGNTANAVQAAALSESPVRQHGLVLQDPLSAGRLAVAGIDNRNPLSGERVQVSASARPSELPPVLAHHDQQGGLELATDNLDRFFSL